MSNDIIVWLREVCIDERGNIAADEIEKLRQQLAECKAREKVLRDALREALDYFQLPGQIFNITWAEEVFSMPSDSTALDAMLKKAKKERHYFSNPLTPAFCKNCNNSCPLS